MKLPSIAFNREMLSHIDEALSKEWLLTNGLGGYASGTVIGVNTRKYHGLLVAALHPPGDRTVCLSKIDEDLIIGEKVYRLGANEFQGLIFPTGFEFLKEFSVAPCPKYVYNSDNVEISKTVFMPKNQNLVSVLYKIYNQNADQFLIRLYPILTCRHFHTVGNQSKNPLIFNQKSGNKKSEIVFQNPPATILLQSTHGEFHEKINWVNGLFYRVEASRGEASLDDCFQPGYFEITVPANEEKEFALTAAVNPDGEGAKSALDSVGCSFSDVEISFSDELNARSSILEHFYGLHPEVPISDWLDWVLFASDSFVVGAGDNKAVIAGYHWFESWGRDTFVSLPGLLLVTGRFEDAKNVLQTYNQYCENGLIPNFVADLSGEASYNTVDATLWYVNAVLQYVKYTGDFAFVKEKLWENLKQILSKHETGTLFDIHLDNDGLLSHGPRLTWMDAEVNGLAVTPRAGKAVEIQALWYNALRTMSLLAARFSEKDLVEKYGSMALKASKNFNEKFWNPKANCLFDCVEPNGADASIRPNQILAISLDFFMLNKFRSEQALAVIDQELLTPCGLRTLAANDNKFIGKYTGDRAQRDLAYHNGVIWPWLLGPYLTAYFKINFDNKPAREQILQKIVLPFFMSGIRQMGLGTLSEIYDCESPNKPGGTIAQAWSVAEPLRAYVEDVMQVKPKFVLIRPRF